MSQALNAPLSKAQHKYLPAACSLGYRYETELPDVTLKCPRQAEIFRSVGTHMRSDPDAPQPGGLCALVTLAEAASPATLLGTARTGGRAAAREKRQKKNVIVVVADVILVVYATEDEEFMYILC